MLVKSISIIHYPLPSLIMLVFKGDSIAAPVETDSVLLAGSPRKKRKKNKTNAATFNDG